MSTSGTEPIELSWGGLYPLTPEMYSYDQLEADELDWELLLELAEFVDGRRSDQLYAEGFIGELEFSVLLTGGGGDAVGLSLGACGESYFLLSEHVRSDSEIKWTRKSSGGQIGVSPTAWIVTRAAAVEALRSLEREGLSALQNKQRWQSRREASGIFAAVAAAERALLGNDSARDPG